ncbi:MAG TPA: amidohydrolase [Candidatus Acidoferrales bacterium]
MRYSLTIFLLLIVAVSAVQVGAGPAEGADWLLVGARIVTVDPDHHVLENGAIAIRRGRILAVGPRADLERKYSGKRVNLTGKLVMPGLVNTHTHAAMTLYRGLADDLALQEWLEKYIFPAESRFTTADFVEWGSKLACLEMIRGGTTTFADMYYFEDQVAKAAAEAGIRGVLGETIIHIPAPDFKTPEETLRFTETFLKRWQGHPLVVPAVAPHSIYLLPAATLQASAKLARDHHAPILIHLSETKKEVEDSRREHGLSPVAYLEKLGVLGPDVLAAHGVWVDAKDIALLQKHGAAIAHNPSSNMKLGSGVAPVVEMLKAGVVVGLGTDGAASNNDLNMFEEMDLAAKLHKLHLGDPRALPARQALEMATILGARALGMGKEIGSLEAGKKADLIVVALDTAHAVPLYNVESQIVYALKASDVESVMVDGRWVMRNRKILTLDEQKVLRQARQYADKVRASLGLH